MKKIIFISLFISCFLYTEVERTKDLLSCGQYEELRKDCGWPGITKEQCIEKNCCFQESQKSGVPWCYHGIDDVPTYTTLTSGKSCALDRELRVECGYLGIEKAECEQRDCCYKIDDYESIVPWCFKGYVDLKTSTSEEKLIYTPPSNE